MSAVTESDIETIRTSEFFDAEWYLETYPDVRAVGMDPAEHYLWLGAKLLRNPSPAFDTKYYLRTYADVARSRINPLLHYLTHGKAERRRPCEPKKGEGRPSLSQYPLVSVIVTNMNGRAHLPDLFRSLENQTYANFEIIFVDDNSTDDSIEIAKQFGVDRIVRTNAVSDKPLGFAGANNLGLKEARGELIALLNNDTRADANWLEALVEAIKASNDIGAVCTKIRFWSPFQEVTVSGRSAFALEPAPLLESLDYKKYFVRAGEQQAGRIRSIERDALNVVRLHLPIQSDEIELAAAPGAPASLDVSVGESSQPTHWATDDGPFRLSLSANQRKTGFHLVNNAGNVEMGHLNPGDRGIGEVDTGQYEEAGDVEYICGCAALVRRDALMGRNLFVDEFVAYYEDAELSARLRHDGYRITYCPRAIVYHKHSSTTVEGSAFWQMHTTRNRFLFRYMNTEPEKRAALKQDFLQQVERRKLSLEARLSLTQAERGFLDAIPTMLKSSDDILRLIDEGQVPRRSSAARIGIYNRYWRTLGGGEAHALNIASILSEYGSVELISEDDFDIDTLGSYFSVDAGRMRKRIVSKMTTQISGEYDLFVNSTYQNEMPSMAPTSYFIVSFPSRTPPATFLGSYHFLANSSYTMGWAERIWGKDSFSGSILCPAVPQEMFLRPGDASQKKRLILSVGRFASSGHTKNQLEIVQAFRMANEAAPEQLKGWELVLVGSVNDSEYAFRVRAEAEGLNARIVTGADFSEVRALYRDAMIYIHASGYGRDPGLEPEKFEHFGMAVAQALGSGCVPIVYDAAGPQEIVETAGVGHTFRDLAGCAELLVEVTGELADPRVAAELRDNMVERARSLFSFDVQAKRLKQLIDMSPMGGGGAAQEGLRA